MARLSINCSSSPTPSQPASTRPYLFGCSELAKAPSLPEKILAIDRALETEGIRHAFGGALALAYYAAPRATDDIDINVFVGLEEHQRVVSLLRPLGVDARGVARVEGGQVRLWWENTPIDLFYANLDFHKAMRRATRSVPFGEGHIRVISPEHLVIGKAAFNRPQDWVDIENLLTVTPVDRAEIDRWAETLIGNADARTTRLTRLENRVLG